MVGDTDRFRARGVLDAWLPDDAEGANDPMGIKTRSGFKRYQETTRPSSTITRTACSHLSTGVDAETLHSLAQALDVAGLPVRATSRFRCSRITSPAVNRGPMLHDQLDAPRQVTPMIEHVRVAK